MYLSCPRPGLNALVQSKREVFLFLETHHLLVFDPKDKHVETVKLILRRVKSILSPQGEFTNTCTSKESV